MDSEDRGKDCPSPEELLLFHRAGLPAGRRKRISAHVGRCLSCKRDSLFIVDILKDEDRVLQEIAPFVPAEKQAFKNQGRFSLQGPRFLAPRYVAAAAMMILASFLLFLLIHPAPRGSTALGKGPTAEFVRLANIPSVTSRSVFAWDDFPVFRYDLGEVPVFASGSGWGSVDVESLNLFAPAGVSNGKSDMKANFRMIAPLDGPAGRPLLRKFSLRK